MYYYSCLLYFNFTHYFYYYIINRISYFHLELLLLLFILCMWRCWDLNPGLPGRQPRSLPLSYLGSLLYRCEFFSIYQRYFACFLNSYTGMNVNNSKITENNTRTLGSCNFLLFLPV